MGGRKELLPESVDTVAKRLKRAQLTATEDAVRKAIFRSFAMSGSSASVRDIMALVPGLDGQALSDICQSLANYDLIVWDEVEQHVQSAYPFSGSPTAHTVRLKNGPGVFALCAVDALGMPVMLKQAADLVSRCEHCNIPIEIAVAPEELGQYHPGETVVWFPLAPDGCLSVAQSRCPDINFFCSPEHQDTWRENRGWPDGQSMTMAEAFEAGREIFGSLLASPEVHLG